MFLLSTNEDKRVVLLSLIVRAFLLIRLLLIFQLHFLSFPIQSIMFVIFTRIKCLRFDSIDSFSFLSSFTNCLW